MFRTLLLLTVACSSLIGSSLGNVVVDTCLQPIVTIVTKARLTVNSLSMPEGSPWCGGKPTYWPAGHQVFNDTPSCLNDNGQWEQPFMAKLDDRIDRHACTALDVNYDGLPDIQCTVGAKEGKGFGYNELYITQEDGSLVKMESGGGLQKYTSMRTRHAVTLEDANGNQLLFIGVKGKPRTDGEPNYSLMYKNIWKEGNDLNGTYFEEVKGPWKQNFDATAVLVADINRDGLDDLIVCSDAKPFLFVQNPNGTWDSVILPDNRKYLWTWRNVRVGDVTGDGIPDLVVAKSGEVDAGFFIFKGMNSKPYFNFATPFLNVNLPFATPDIELLDVNGDGRWDLYVVQVDEKKDINTFCAKTKSLWGDVSRWWGNDSNNYKAPPPLWVPPLDEAQDLLYIANDDYSFDKVTMNHAYPGCGGMVTKYGNNRTLSLFQGTFVHPGYNLLLQW